MTRKAVAALVAALMSSTATLAAETKIVSWNMGPGLYEAVLERVDDIREMDQALAPDVLILIEVAGINEVRLLAQSLGWDEWYAATNNGLRLTSATSSAIETAVISRIPIERVIEYDMRPEGSTHPVISFQHPDGDLAIPVTEVELTSRGISNVDPTAHTDRGTIRVDLKGGLTVFPIHLKSNLNGVCIDASNAAQLLKDLDLPPLDTLADIQGNGNSAKASEDHRNAKKRERVIAAIKRVADEAALDRTVILAGDYNTSFEAGKVGTAFADCQIQPFSCAKAPFPADMCQGDGFDDTFPILTAPLVGSTSWDVLTEELGRTYDDTAFADKAIDHLSVPASQAAAFDGVGKADDTFGSDHYPIFVSYTAP